MTITKDDVEYAKSVLLSEEENFDDERITFIRNLDSIDLQACPGSGKTTCLLAKLLIIGRHLPLKEGGVLVLSHTNAAINEIKTKTSAYVPELFQYPNFIGTIQSFVDHFLAVPFYTQTYGHQPIRIDDEIFNEKVWKPRAARGWLSRQNDETAFLQSLRFDKDGNLIKWIDGSKDNFPLRTTTNTYRALLVMRKKLLSEGYLCYDDAYYLAERYFDKFPLVAELLQKRFAFVFIDEMQDTDTHQISILDTIFPNDCHSTVQRIGDQNQAIYGKRVKSNLIWVPREGHLTLNGSMRLSECIADTVKNISIQPQEFSGNSSRVNIKPKIFLFNDSTIEKVLPEFAKTIIKDNLHIKEKAVFKAVGWVKLNKKGGKKGIDSYFSGFSAQVKKNKVDFDSLEEYLYCSLEDLDKKGLNIIRMRILAVIVKALRVEKIKTENDKSFTIHSLIKFLRENCSDEYESFKLQILSWCLDVYKGSDIKDNLAAYIRHLLQDIFSVENLKSGCEEFLNKSVSNDSRTDVDDKELVEDNYFSYQDGEDEVRIEVATIHSVKGETHTATLYLETYYYNDSGKSYESQRLFEQLKGSRINGSLGKRVQESQKMAYVGMTRATDLLCVAVHKAHIPDNEITNFQSKWDIIDITTNQLQS